MVSVTSTRSSLTQPQRSCESCRIIGPAARPICEPCHCRSWGRARLER